MKVYGAYKVRLGDEEYVWEPDQWLGSVWMQMQTDLDLGYRDFMQKLDQRDFRSIQWLIWHLRGRVEDRLSVDFPLMQFEAEVIPDPEDEAVSGTSETATTGSSSSVSGSSGPTGTP